MPGRTPIRVPTMAPMKAYMRLMGVSATPKPRARWLTRSMNRCSVGPGPERELEIEAEYEDTGRKRSKKNSADQGFLRPKLRTRRARGKDQPNGRQHQAEMGHDQAEGDDAAEHDEYWLPIPSRKRFTFDFQRAQRQRGTEHKQEDAQNTREVARTHASRAAQRIVASDDDRGEAERDENQACEKVLRMANERHGSLLRKNLPLLMSCPSTPAGAKNNIELRGKHRGHCAPGAKAEFPRKRAGSLVAPALFDPT